MRLVVLATFAVIAATPLKIAAQVELATYGTQPGPIVGMFQSNQSVTALNPSDSLQSTFNDTQFASSMSFSQSYNPTSLVVGTIPSNGALAAISLGQSVDSTGIDTSSITALRVITISNADSGLGINTPPVASGALSYGLSQSIVGFQTASTPMYYALDVSATWMIGATGPSSVMYGNTLARSLVNVSGIGQVSTDAIIRSNTSSNGSVTRRIYGVIPDNFTAALSVASGSVTTAGASGSSGTTASSIVRTTAEVQFSPTQYAISASELTSGNVEFFHGEWIVPTLAPGETINAKIWNGANLVITGDAELGAMNFAEVEKLDWNNGAVKARLTLKSLRYAYFLENITTANGAGIEFDHSQVSSLLVGGVNGGTLAPGANSLFELESVSLSLGGVGTAQADGTLTLGTGSALDGNWIVGESSFALNVLNSGTIRPGHSAGLLELTGNLILDSSSSLDLEIGGITPGTGFDQLFIQQSAGDPTQTGFVQLNGNLQLTFLDDYQSHSGLETESFTLIYAEGGVVGSFSNVANGQRLFTTDGHGSFQITITSNSVIASQFSPVPEPLGLLLPLGAILIYGRIRGFRLHGSRSRSESGVASTASLTA